MCESQQNVNPEYKTDGFENSNMLEHKLKLQLKHKTRTTKQSLLETKIFKVQILQRYFLYDFRVKFRKSENIIDFKRTKQEHFGVYLIPMLISNLIYAFTKAM